MFLTSLCIAAALYESYLLSIFRLGTNNGGTSGIPASCYMVSNLGVKRKHTNLGEGICPLRSGLTRSEDTSVIL